MRKKAKWLFVLVAIALTLLVVAFDPQTRYWGASWLKCRGDACPCAEQRAIAVAGRRGAVVSAQKSATRVGLDILQAGGNAVDAAVAMGYALAVTHPCCGNLGGGGFMVIHRNDDEDIFLNFRETAPQKASPELYQSQDNSSTRGYLAVGVPGTVMGLETARERYGTKSRQELIAPAIARARSGFVLQKGDVEILKRLPQGEENVNRIFRRGESAYQVGERLVQLELAASLEQIANGGTAAFYEGAIATEIVRASQAKGGILSFEDLANYSAVESVPLTCNYRGYRVLTTPLPGGGVTLCQLLSLLEGYDFSQLEASQRLHYTLSAMVYAYSDRNTQLGDPNFIDDPTKRLLSPGYIEQLRQEIPVREAIAPEELFPQPEGHNTTHYSVVDGDGMAVSLTYTINSYFGAGVIAGNTGFFLNNEMDDFTTEVGVPNQFGLVQGAANLVAPRKRPLSSMSPTIVLDPQGQLFLVTGSPGGPTIITTVLRIIQSIIDDGMTLAAATTAPRLHYQGLPPFIISEPYALHRATMKDLRSRGYEVRLFSPWGAAESIQVEADGSLSAVNDCRRPAGGALTF